MSQTSISHSSPSVSSHGITTRSESDASTVPGGARPGGLSTDSPWPARELELLERWAEGLSARDIATRMRLSPGQVSGRLHRLKLAKSLPARDNGPRSHQRRRPLSAELETQRRLRIGAARRAQAGSPPQAQAAPPSGCPAAPGVAVLPLGAPEPPSLPPTPPEAIAAPANPPARAPAPAVLAYGRVTTCCWPIGDPRRPGFHFCEDPTEPGGSYCAEHAGLAFARKPYERQEAA